MAYAISSRNDAEESSDDVVYLDETVVDPTLTYAASVDESMRVASNDTIHPSANCGVVNSCDQVLGGGAGGGRAVSGKTISNSNGVTIRHYGTNDVHKPAHVHIMGSGPHTRVGQNGKPLKGQPELTSKQRRQVNRNLKTIRREMRKVGRANKFNQDNGF